MVVFCTYCGQSFTRDEHLERHILTHTNIKPFKCFTCHMSFARRDLLQRHYTVHGRDQNNQEGLPPSEGIIPKSAGRTPIACSNCAKTKTKCDKKFPCSRCEGRNLKCTLRSTRRISKGVNRAYPPAEATKDIVSLEKNVRHSPKESVKRSPKPLTSQCPQDQQSSNLHQHGCSEFAESQCVDDLCFYENPMTFLDQDLSTPVMPSSSEGISYIQYPPLLNYDDLSLTSKAVLEPYYNSSYLLDWQSNLPIPYDTKLDSELVASDLLHESEYLNSYSSDGIMDIAPDLSASTTLVQTPIATPKIDETLAETVQYDLTSKTDKNPSPSIGMNDTREIPALIGARNGWNVFKISTQLTQTSCPITAKLYLEQLEEVLKDCESWINWQSGCIDLKILGADRVAVVPFQESCREKLLAITQAFLHKAIDTHRGDTNELSTVGGCASRGGFSFILLPPAGVLNQFLQAYANIFELYFPLGFRGMLDPNETLKCYNEKASSLLILMMIAQGAANFCSGETRSLTAGLTEVCRISLYDLVEKNILLSADPIILHSAMIFIYQAAWSGDKWQMDIAMGQRGMYIAMLRHAGFVNGDDGNFSYVQDTLPDYLWQKWARLEMRSRLLYCWAMVDQELSLFHDTVPLFATSDFAAPMPDSDSLWYAKTANDWASTYQQEYTSAGTTMQKCTNGRPMSLRDSFQQFTDTADTLESARGLTALQLRLLLHPLQALVAQFRQFSTCFPLRSTKHTSAQVAAGSTSASFELNDLQVVLCRWHELVKNYLATKNLCPLVHASLVLYHLISLNVMTNFSVIEQSVREEICFGKLEEPAKTAQMGILDVPQAAYHCEQVIILARSMHRSIRPAWWSGAVYRACLILRCVMLTDPKGKIVQLNLCKSSCTTSLLSLDKAFIQGHEPAAADTKAADSQEQSGGLPNMHNARDVVSYCVSIIDEGSSTRLSDGIRAKLSVLLG